MSQRETLLGTGLVLLLLTLLAACSPWPRLSIGETGKLGDNASSQKTLALYSPSGLVEVKNLLWDEQATQPITSEEESYQKWFWASYQTRLISLKDQMNLVAEEYGAEKFTLEIKGTQVYMKVPRSQKTLNLTPYVFPLKAGMGNIQVSRVKVVEFTYGWGQLYYFHLSNDKAWAYLAVHWQEGKPGHVIPLHRYGIKDVVPAFNLEGERMYDAGAYLQEQGGKRIVIAYDARKNRRTEYVLPDEITGVHSMLWAVQHYQEVLDMVVSLAGDTGYDRYVAKLSLNHGTLVGTIPFKPLQDKQEWSFNSGLRLNFVVGGTRDTLFVTADDGEFSGYHMEENFHAIDRRTGRPKWSVKGGYLPIDHV